MSFVNIQHRECEAVLSSARHAEFFFDDRTIRWPKTYDVFGVNVAGTTYAQVTDVLIRCAKFRRPTIVDFAPVSILVEASRNPVFRSRLNSFDLVCPDGQPVRWYLNHFENLGLPDTVCGTTTTLRLCEAAAREGISIYLYGSTSETLRELQARLLSHFPRLQIAGAESPPFTLLGPEERRVVASRINDSGAGLVFIGIGSPKQENFVWEQQAEIKAVQLCVGAAFDFIAGTKKRAPQWVQRIGLEWFHRLCSEPVRLGKRYTVGNLRFMALLLPRLLRLNGTV
jgi:N-acetylglucosaminyldiphosphoundecaprenol N-acetyl-beta-D-mannosaminyltransferase